MCRGSGACRGCRFRHTDNSSRKRRGLIAPGGTSVPNVRRHPVVLNRCPVTIVRSAQGCVMAGGACRWTVAARRLRVSGADRATFRLVFGRTTLKALLVL